MPRKRQRIQNLKQFQTSASASASASGRQTERTTRSVNDILADLRRSSLGPSSPASLPTNVPSVPPVIREILQIPETPAPRPRRPVRQRRDGSGRLLPAGPPPPRSWVSSSSNGGSPAGSLMRNAQSRLADTTLPDANLPEKGSLVDIVLQRLAFNWDFHRVYDQFHLFYLPSHLKSALIRWVGLMSEGGVTLSDLKLLWLPPPGAIDEDVEDVAEANAGVTYLDLSGSVGRSIKLKELSELLFSHTSEAPTEEPQESWDNISSSPSPPRALLPNLTHLSLALDPHHGTMPSWRQLLSLSSKLSTVTHLSLAYWPDPCFTPRAKLASVTTPQGQTVPYGGTNYYSHSIDHDWSEALLVLRMLSSRLYALEYLDLTGCSAWFESLKANSEHDHVDWVGNWGKITVLKLCMGWTLHEDALPSEQAAFVEAIGMATRVEKHIRACRAGKGRFITVEKDRLDI